MCIASMRPSFWRQVLLISGVSFGYYITLHFLFQYGISDQFLFNQLDAGEYHRVGLSFFDGPLSEGTLVRPYLYPLMSVLGYKLFGAIGVWSMQLLFLIASVLLVFVAVLRVTASVRGAWAAAVILLLNLSLFALIYHGLTEVTTTCIGAAIALRVVTAPRELFTPRIATQIALLLAIASVVKALFVPFLICWCIVVGMVAIRRKTWRKRNVALFLLALAPLLPQLVIMQLQHGRFGISDIGSHTLKNYLIARSYGEVHGTPLEGARPIIVAMDTEEIFSYAAGSFSSIVNLYVVDMKDNLYNSGGNTLELVRPPGLLFAPKLMARINQIYAMVLLGLGVLYKVRKGMRSPWIVPWTLLGAMNYYILMVSGISFWQGDRLVVFGICIWIVQYALTLVLLRGKIGSTDPNPTLT